jgi:uncharacterized membrane protein YccC
MGSNYYWNKDNFEGLLAVAAELRMDPHLEPLARYCELREKGLRKQALSMLDEFLEEAETWDTATARSLVVTILEVYWSRKAAHQFLTAPLQQRLIEPVLEEWCRAEPENPLPARHFALLRSDVVLLEAALRLDPDDQAVRATLARKHIAFVDYATHHLVEGCFIDDEAEASRALEEADKLLEVADDSVAVRQL